jgi:AbrB family looped-hinge helix DNA binding protein
MSTLQSPLKTTYANGQISIPSAVREKLALVEGMQLQFVERDGQIVIERSDASLASLCGVLTATHPVSLADMDRAVGAAIAEKFADANASR